MQAITMYNFVLRSRLKNSFSLLLTLVKSSRVELSRPNKLVCLYMAVTFQSSLTFAGNTRTLPKKEASERSSICVCSGLALKF